jgi:hypothetical protein
MAAPDIRWPPAPGTLHHMALFARDPLAAERLVRLLHAPTWDGSIVRAKLSLHFSRPLARHEADELADRAATRAARILGAARRASDLNGCETDVITSITASLGPEPRLRLVELELFAPATSSGMRRKVSAAEDALNVDRKPTLPPPAPASRGSRPDLENGSRPPSMLTAPMLVRALHQAGVILADALLRRHESVLRRSVPTLRTDAVSLERAELLLSWAAPESALPESAPRERAAWEEPGSALDLSRWRAAFGAEAVQRVHEEACLAATYLLHQALFVPGTGPTTSGALAIAGRAFPQAQLARGLARYVETEASLHATLARAVAEALAGAQGDELTEALVLAVPAARETLREAVRAARA